MENATRHIKSSLLEAALSAEVEGLARIDAAQRAAPEAPTTKRPRTDNQLPAALPLVISYPTGPNGAVEDIGHRISALAGAVAVPAMGPQVSDDVDGEDTSGDDAAGPPPAWGERTSGRTRIPRDTAARAEATKEKNRRAQQRFRQRQKGRMEALQTEVGRLRMLLAQNGIDTGEHAPDCELQGRIWTSSTITFSVAGTSSNLPPPPSLSLSAARSWR